MAYLNVRERRVETKIAYVGPLGSGKATNLEQLGLRAAPRPASSTRSISDDVGEVITLDWTAPPEFELRDCALTVKVVAASGPPSLDRVRAMVRDADGVVLVLDARESAAEDNGAVVAHVRDALAATGKTRVPVVVQVNKTDLPDARSSSDVVATLGAAWPVVGAAATRGEGVVETLERALADVLAGLKTDGQLENGEDARPTRQPLAPRAEGNPLLNALRDVLRQTMTEHATRLEERFADRFADRFTARFDELRDFMKVSVEQTTRALAAHVGAIASLERRMSEGDRFADVVESIAKTAARVDELKAQLDRAREELKSEVIRAQEIRSRGDREHLATMLVPVRRATEALSAEIKQTDARAGVATLADALVGLRDELEASSQRESAEARDMREALVRRVAGVEELVIHNTAELQSSTARAAAEIEALRAQVTELIDELKRKEKKGWFG
jgi:signal recognition particle receptor subunit beta